MYNKSILNQVAIHKQQTYLLETVLYVDFSTIVTFVANWKQLWFGVLGMIARRVPINLAC